MNTSGASNTPRWCSWIQRVAWHATCLSPA